MRQRGHVSNAVQLQFDIQAINIRNRPRAWQFVAIFSNA
jgi:hypothetical protein